MTTPEFISRSAVKAMLHKYEEWDCPPDNAALRAVDEIRENVNKIPAEDAAPVIHAKWIKCSGGNATCSGCGTRQFAVYDDDDQQHYCGHCGARMDGE